MKPPLFVLEPGWEGMFTRDEHPGALPNAIRVRKVNSEPGDAREDGKLGTILGSIGHPDVGLGYFVERDNRPKRAVFVIAKKVEPV